MADTKDPSDAEIEAAWLAYRDTASRSTSKEVFFAGARRGSAAAPAASPVVDELATLIRMLVHALRKAAPGNALAERAMDYLKRHDLTGNVLRDSPAVEGAWQKFCEEVGAPAAPASPDARDAPAEPPVLWCVHVIGPDDLYAFPTLAAAQENAKALTAFMERQPKSIHDPICIPVVTVWPHSPESHAADLRENIFTKPSSKGEGTPS